jgi:Tol biopolymer transport system component
MKAVAKEIGSEHGRTAARGTESVAQTSGTVSRDVESRPPIWLLAFGAAALGGLVVALVLTAGSGEATKNSPEAGGASGVHFHEGEEIMNVLVTAVEGGVPQRVTTTHGHGFTVSAPDWSPDGSRLAFGLARCHGCPMQVHVVEAPAPGEEPPTPDALGGGFNPEWSPDGTSLVYVGARGGIYTMSSDGSDKRLLVGGPDSYDEPTWSTSDRIAFLKQEPDGAWHVYTMTPDGTGIRRLTRGPESEANPAWSPDGSRLAFTRQLELRWVLHVVEASGGRGRAVLRGPASDTYPSWSPDGSRLAFVRQEVDRLSLATVSLDGGRPAPIPDTGPRAVQPAWSPDGERIAFVGPGLP